MCCICVILSIVQLSVWLCKHTLVNEVLLGAGIVLGRISAYMTDARTSDNKIKELIP